MADTPTTGNGGDTAGSDRPDRVVPPHADCCSIDAVRFILGASESDCERIILSGGFPECHDCPYRGVGVSVEALDSWLGRHAEELPAGKSFRLPVRGLSFDAQYRESEHDRTPPKGKPLGLGVPANMVPERLRWTRDDYDRLYPAGDGIPRDFSGHPYEPLDWGKVNGS